MVSKVWIGRFFRFGSVGFSQVWIGRFFSGLDRSVFLRFGSDGFFRFGSDGFFRFGSDGSSGLRSFQKIRDRGFSGIGSSFTRILEKVSLGALSWDLDSFRGQLLSLQLYKDG
jgi:hypothetical protein